VLINYVDQSQHSNHYTMPPPVMYDQLHALPRYYSNSIPPPENARQRQDPTFEGTFVRSINLLFTLHYITGGSRQNSEWGWLPAPSSEQPWFYSGLHHPTVWNVLPVTVINSPSLTV